MLETLTDVQGIVIAAAILYAAKELKRVSNEVSRVSTAIHALDRRVDDLERVLVGERVPNLERRPGGNPRASESRRDCSSGS